MYTRAGRRRQPRGRKRHTWLSHITLTCRCTCVPRHRRRTKVSLARGAARTISGGASSSGRDMVWCVDGKEVEVEGVRQRVGW
jgi:hypothetical protein